MVSTIREPGAAGFDDASIVHELIPTTPSGTVVEVVVVVVVVVDVVVVAGAGAIVVMAGAAVVVVTAVVLVVDVVVVASAVHCAWSESPPAGMVIEALSAWLVPPPPEAVFHPESV